MEYYILDNGDFTDEKPSTYYKFKYPPDHFQNYGFIATHKGDNILVTAHTGAGKTSLALEAIAMHLRNPSDDFQVVYTGPIKTLINQKYKEFSEDFDDVGIMTGDVKINPGGKLLVMTAEILRNAIMRKDSKDADIYEWQFDSNKVKCVILDEVHFINNPDRGMVWEEIITNLDPSIQLVMLSATINGAEKLAKWVGRIKQKICHHIPTPFRPVPLKHFIFWDDELHLLLEGDNGWHPGVWDNVRNQINPYKKTKAKKKKLKSPSFYLERLVSYLEENNQLPANIFLLNKISVEKTANGITMNFNDHNEISKIETIWNKYLLKYRSIYGTSQQWNMIKGLALKGIGIHHSGLIPILKEIVEILYEQKLIKVLIATETFAMGVNMPTKTTIFTNLTKFDGRTKRLLNTEEYIQMAGRAGRRGLDSYGTVVILPSKNIESEDKIRRMMTGNSRLLESRISFDYSYILKQLYNFENSTMEISFDDFIVENINMTYFGTEINGYVNQDKIKVEELRKEIDMISIDDDKFKIYQQLKEVEEKLNAPKNSWIVLSKKQVKNLTKNKDKLIKNLGEYNEESYKKKWNLIEKLNNISKNIGYTESSIKEQIRVLVSFLSKHNFVEVDDKTSLTTYGKIMSQVNECNPIILGYMIKSNIFSKLSFEELVALLSIFIDDSSLESDSIDNLHRSGVISTDLMNKMYEIADIKYSFSDQEDQLNNSLPYPIKSDWDLHTNMLTAVKEWATGKNWVEIYHLYPTFEGNFIKNVLRLTNLMKNVYMIAKLIKDVALINIMEGFEEKLIRDFVTIDSLYL